MKKTIVSMLVLLLTAALLTVPAFSGEGYDPDWDGEDYDWDYDPELDEEDYDWTDDLDPSLDEDVDEDPDWDLEEDYDEDPDWDLTDWDDPELDDWDDMDPMDDWDEEDLSWEDDFLWEDDEFLSDEDDDLWEDDLSWEDDELIRVEMLPLSEEGELLIEDYSVIEIPAEYLEVTPDLTEFELEMLFAELLSGDGTDAAEMTDALVKEHSAELLGTQIDTVSEVKTWLQEELYRNMLQDEIMAVLEEKTQIISYGEEEYALVRTYVEQDLAQQQAIYEEMGMEMTPETIALDMGYASVEDYVLDETRDCLDRIMILEKIAEDLDISCTEEEVDEAVRASLEETGEESDEESDEEREISDAWYYVFSRTEVLYGKVMKALEQNVVQV